MTWRKPRLGAPTLDAENEIVDRPGRVEPDGEKIGMNRRGEYEGRGAPPTAKYWYGTGGRRWAGKGRKAPLRSWKRDRDTQWKEGDIDGNETED
ncbi:hypothetical protein HFN89_06315 [Rhizobium laguerreae]|nr:hypothetical protein [Rhizobium laguerreae]